MNKDQKLLEEAYQKVCESLYSFEDNRLTRKEEILVDAVVNEIFDRYPGSLHNIMSIVVLTTRHIFENPNLEIVYARDVYDVFAFKSSPFVALHAANKVLKNDQQLRNDFKKQVADKITERFEMPYVPPLLQDYIEERTKEIRTKRLERKINKELDKDFNIDLEDF
jgi:hypothetical protein